MTEKTLTFASPHTLSELYRNKPENLERAEKALGVNLVSRDNWLKIESESQSATDVAAEFFEILALARKQGMRINQLDFESSLKKTGEGKIAQLREIFENPIILNLKRKSIVPKSLSQKNYLRSIQKDDIVFGVGAAGTGKTYLAVASALSALYSQKVEKIILTRPAVEAGEALGFLPGDLQEKLLPYLRPLYDALYDFAGPEETERMMAKGVLEIAPLAYMRGRTLTNAFVILDEAQNTTTEQMMMFLTRLGENSRMVVTGDITQVDLPRNKKSGLKDAVEILKDIDGIKLFYFSDDDVVRHPLVVQIVRAYQKTREE